MHWKSFSAAATLLLLTACGGGGDDGATLSSNANLSSLALDSGVLTPAFAAATLSYTTTVTGGTNSIRVTAVTADSRSRLSIDGIATASGTPSNPIALVIGDTTIAIEVTAQTGAVRAYQVRVSRPPPNTDARLSDLQLTAGALVQIFDPALTNYDATTGHLGASTRVLAEFRDPLASALAVDGLPFEAGLPGPIIDLAVGDTTVNVVATAEDGVTTETYTVTATRADFMTLAQRAYVKATDPGPDRFSTSLALAGDTLLAGAPREQSSATGVDGDDANDNLLQAGAAYLYDRIGGVWTVSNYLKASNTDSGDRFGSAVAATQESLIIGAPGEQSLDGTQADNSGNSVGAVYVFDRVGLAIPAQTGYLKAGNRDSLDGFGGAVGASGDRILIGAQFESSSATGVNGDGSDNSLTNAGAAYLFEKNGAGTWTQIAYLKASNAASNAEFANALDLSDQSLAIGAWREASGSSGVNGDQNNTAAPDSGAVYLFDRSSSGTWSQAAYIKASNTQQDDNFGASVALDGDLLVVGAPGESSDGSNPQDNSLSGAGAVYVYSRSASGAWSFTDYLKASTPGFRDFFGARVALVGNMLAVGAPGERSNATGINQDETIDSELDAGAVYLFERNAAGTWNQIAYLKASNTDAGDLFGNALALDGDTLAVGAPEEQSGTGGVNGNQFNNTQLSAGAVYLFH